MLVGRRCYVVVARTHGSRQALKSSFAPIHSSFPLCPHDIVILGFAEVTRQRPPTALCVSFTSALEAHPPGVMHQLRGAKGEAVKTLHVRSQEAAALSSRTISSVQLALYLV